MPAIQIDPFVVFELPADAASGNPRKASIDALELSDFHSKLFKEHGAENPATGRREVAWDTIISEFQRWVPEHSLEKVQVSRSEAVAIAQHADSSWLEKKRAWSAPTASSSPSLPASTELPSAA